MTQERQDAHSQATPARNGSPSHVSMAHQPNGMRTQLRPAPAISAKSFSVCRRGCACWKEEEEGDESQLEAL